MQNFERTKDQSLSMQLHILEISHDRMRLSTGYYAESQDCVVRSSMLLLAMPVTPSIQQCLMIIGRKCNGVHIPETMWPTIGYRKFTRKRGFPCALRPEYGDGPLSDETNAEFSNVIIF